MAQVVHSIKNSLDIRGISILFASLSDTTLQTINANMNNRHELSRSDEKHRFLFQSTIQKRTGRIYGKTARECT
jgi:hypothetical protein